MPTVSDIPKGALYIGTKTAHWSPTEVRRIVNFTDRCPIMHRVNACAYLAFGKTDTGYLVNVVSSRRVYLFTLDEDGDVEFSSAVAERTFFDMAADFGMNTAGLQAIITQYAPKD